VIVGALHALISGTLTFGPRIFLLALVAVLLAALTFDALPRSPTLLAELGGLPVVQAVVPDQDVLWISLIHLRN